MATYYTHNELCKVLLWKLEQGILKYYAYRKFLKIADGWDALGFWADKIYDDMCEENYRGDWEKRMYQDLKYYMKYEGKW